MGFDILKRCDNKVEPLSKAVTTAILDYRDGVRRVCYILTWYMPVQTHSRPCFPRFAFCSDLPRGNPQFVDLTPLFVAEEVVLSLAAGLQD